jgi:CRP-like cAMP-binding protein
VKKGRRLFQEHDDADRLYIVTSGKIKLAHASGDGRETLVMIAGPGDTFGELAAFDSGQRTSTAIAITDSQVDSLRTDALFAWLTDHPQAAQALFKAVATRMRHMMGAQSDLIFVDVPGRVAKALIELSSKFGSPTTSGVLVNHDLTQEELAQFVGASRETVNKALADFASRGWIRLETRSVEIVDLERLEKRAK